MLNLTHQDIDILEQWWIKKSRVNFFIYRQFMSPQTFKYNWFIEDLCSKLQQFYLDFKAGKRPILFIQSPPQHGKSWSINDFITWFIGKLPKTKIIFASYSDMLGIRCNTYFQRTLMSFKYKKIFPVIQIPDTRKMIMANKVTCNKEQIDFLSNKKLTGGQFRNTTVKGRVTGETLDLGIIDDPVKGREEANSYTMSQKIWNWFTDDFYSRFSENAGLIIIMTRWNTHDLIGRFIEKYKELDLNINIVNYKAIATDDEKYRKINEPLFPKLKSLEFLLKRKNLMPMGSWDSLYQGSPTVQGGNVIKDKWWRWWKILPQLKYKFITADTAQKEKKQNDFTDLKCWGYGIDDNIYLLDHYRNKIDAPTLRRITEIFYKKHNTKRIELTDPILRGMYIEDKSSGTGLIQELKRSNLKIYNVPRIRDKVFRAEDASPYIEAGKVYLNTDISDIDNTIKEAREFPNSKFDDDFDTVMMAVEIAFINKNAVNSLQAAMEAD